MTASADLAEVCAALALVAQATPGPMTVGRFAHDNDLDSAAAIHVATGETIATFDNADRTDEASPVREAIAMIALHNAAPAIAAAVEELTAARTEIAALRSQVCRLVSGQEIDGWCGHGVPIVEAVRRLLERDAAEREVLRADLDAAKNDRMLAIHERDRFRSESKQATEEVERLSALLRAADAAWTEIKRLTGGGR